MVWRGFFGAGGGEPDNIRYRRLRYVFFSFLDSDIVAPMIVQILPVAVIPHRSLRVGVPGEEKVAAHGMEMRMAAPSLSIIGHCAILDIARKPGYNGSKENRKSLVVSA